MSCTYLLAIPWIETGKDTPTSCSGQILILRIETLLPKPKPREPLKRLQQIELQQSFQQRKGYLLILNQRHEL